MTVKMGWFHMVLGFGLEFLLYSSHSAGALPARVYSFHRHGDKWFPRPFPRCLNEFDPPMECMERLLKFSVIACAEAEDRL
jgi:hypothetical protein